ncbi:hybrid sensor histidine kinase/response regulator [Caenimonas aquaedulcis]|uniref:histidine kinase n=1 Tax=Caenimonas aquaedulcis TaxID=2793270 RepID=A0A931H347_9BURK|nr:response regulator [Caenimonas aquaedulcis]MBG9387711.1 response regulator [Caenimonas aquaedulcis]
MSERAVSDTRALRVLLLEDSRFDVELLREALLDCYPRATLEVVSTEDRFSLALAHGGWDVILSDYELPGFSGSQALELAREQRPRTPFIFVSGVIGEDNAVEMLKRGATDYVSKQRLSRLPVVLERALREVADREGRDRAEARLREADAIFARVVESLTDYAVILLDAAGRVRSWNRGARDIFGFSDAQVIGNTAELLFTPEDRAAGVFRKEMADALADGSAECNRWMSRSDGLHLRAEGVMTPLYDDARRHNGFCKIVRDVTAAWRDAEALRVAKEQAEHANQAKDQFLAVLSHELRTPLSPIVAATHLLERTATVPEHQQHLLPMIRRNVALEARLIDDLLDLTAITAGKVSLKTTAVDMHQVIHRVVDMLGEQVAHARLELVLELRASQCMVSADEARMQQVVWNILRNAIKFTPPGGRVALHTQSGGGRFTFECSDTGAGIAPEALDRIFTPFEQADRELSHRVGGLGLGLAIARGLVTEHRGQLVAHSDGPGRGATFTLILDTLAVPGAAAPGVDAPAAPSPSRSLRVLLVEDNIDAADTMVLVLESYGYRVTHAATCTQALATARDTDFDVVLTDLGLPDGSGIDVGRALSGTVPVVALSGYGATPDLQRSAMAGFSGHLVKPAEPEAIHRALQKAYVEREAQSGKARATSTA